MVSTKGTASIAAGALASTLGIFELMIGLHVLKPDHSTADPAPLWIAGLAGGMFFLGGIVVIIKTLMRGEAGPDGGLPMSAPLWLRAIYDLMGVFIGISLAAIASWIAFGPDTRQFSGISTFGTFVVGESAGRTVFGIGAIMMWGIALAIAVNSVRSLFPRRKA